MAQDSHRRSGSSGRSTKRKRVVIGANETVRVTHDGGAPKIDSGSRRTASASRRRASAEQRRSSTSPADRRKTGARRQASGLAAAKRDERERRQRAARRRRLLWVAGVVGLLAATTYGAFALYHSQAFAIQEVTVTGATRVGPVRVRDLAALPADATLLRVDPVEIERRIETLPWIAQATVARDFPHTLSITVVEREPAAVVEIEPGKRWLIATDGMWLAPRSKVASEPFTIIRDVELKQPKAGAVESEEALVNAIDVIAGLSPDLRSRVTAVSAPTVERTTLRTKDKVEILVGSADDMNKKDAIVRKILAEQGDKVVFINVRTTDRPTWRGLE